MVGLVGKMSLFCLQSVDVSRYYLTLRNLGKVMHSSTVTKNS